MYHDTGGVLFGPKGPLVGSGSACFLPDGGAVVRSGDTWNGPKGMYVLSGDTLFGPNGRTWMGVRPEDVPAIVDQDG